MATIAGDDIGQIIYTCKICKRSEGFLGWPIGVCAQCNTTAYCTRDCLAADYPHHIKVCGKSVLDIMTAPYQLNQRVAATEILRVEGLNHMDVYDRLIDCYVFRWTDEKNFSRTIPMFDNLPPLTGASVDFGNFLLFAAMRNDLLPDNWNPQDRLHCVHFFEKREVWGTLNAGFLGEGDVIAKYQDFQMPMKLRVLAEEILQRKVYPPWEIRPALNYPGV